MTSADKSKLVKRLAEEVGFDLAGIARAEPSERGGYYRDWLARGHVGSMAYLARNVELRSDPRGLLSDARSIIVVAILYKRSDGYRPASAAATAAPTGRIAQYVRGVDYHVVIRRMLQDLAARMRDQIREPFRARPCVDTAPLLERDVARAAGLGWIGKNTCLLNGTLGSYLLLGELITTLELAADEPVAERCRSCTRCLDACPTNALIAPYQMDASRCISYLTIEHRGDLPPDLQTQIGDWLLGCDICQQVCPYNSKAPLVRHAEISMNRLPPRIDLEGVLSLEASGYRALVADTAATRVTLPMLRRNASAVADNAIRDSQHIAARGTAMPRSDADAGQRAGSDAAARGGGGTSEPGS